MLALNAGEPGYYDLEASFNVSNNLPNAPYHTEFYFSRQGASEYGPITVITKECTTNVFPSSASGNWSNSGDSSSSYSVHRFSLRLSIGNSNIIIMPFIQKVPFNGQIILLARGSYVQLTKLPTRITDAP
jgi:hypothetical protein